MFLQGMARTLFMVNVPLFLILTGYLNLNKRVSRGYYRGMVAVLLSYLVISVVTIFFVNTGVVTIIRPSDGCSR